MSAMHNRERGSDSNRQASMFVDRVYEKATYKPDSGLRGQSPMFERSIGNGETSERGNGFRFEPYCHEEERFETQMRQHAVREPATRIHDKIDKPEVRRKTFLSNETRECDYRLSRYESTVAIQRTVVKSN